MSLPIRKQLSVSILPQRGGTLGEEEAIVREVALRVHQVALPAAHHITLDIYREFLFENGYSAITYRSEITNYTHVEIYMSVM